MSSKPYHSDLTSSKSLHDNDDERSSDHINTIFVGFGFGRQQQPQQQTPQSLPQKDQRPNQQQKEMILFDEKNLNLNKSVAIPQGIPKNQHSTSQDVSVKQPHQKKKSFMARRKPLLTRSAVSVKEAVLLSVFFCCLAKEKRP